MHVKGSGDIQNKSMLLCAGLALCSAACVRRAALRGSCLRLGLLQRACTGGKPRFWLLRAAWTTLQLQVICHLQQALKRKEGGLRLFGLCEAVLKIGQLC